MRVATETSTGVPHRRADHCAGPRDAPHLGDGLIGLWHKMQHEQRKDTVEASIWKRQRAGISYLEGNPRIIILARGVSDVDG